MNFDTRYLVRWGIPGWIMIMSLSPYFAVVYFPLFKDISSSTSAILGIIAALTAFGVPLGYLLNQIFHALFWVIPKLFSNSWDLYFKKELLMDQYLHKNENMRQRYRDLLTRKHELGSMTLSLWISFFVILLVNIFTTGYPSFAWKWNYCYVLLCLSVLITVSSLYSSQNIKKYASHIYIGVES